MHLLDNQSVPFSIKYLVEYKLNKAIQKDKFFYDSMLCMLYTGALISY